MKYLFVIFLLSIATPSLAQEYYGGMPPSDGWWGPPRVVVPRREYREYRYEEYQPRRRMTPEYYDYRSRCAMHPMRPECSR